MIFKRVIGNLLLMSVVTVITLLTAEAAVRMMYKDSVWMYPRYQTAAHYGQYAIRTLRPNSVFWHTSVDGHWRFETNNKGFRSTRNFSYQKPAGTVRVLTLGDSHTQGFEARQNMTYSEQLQQQLLQSGINAEVINTGVSGFSNAEELVLLENEGIRYQPDYVVLGFFANDFQDNISSGLFELNDDMQLVEKKYSYLPGVKIQDTIYAIPGVQWLSENSYFYSMLFNKTWAFIKYMRGGNHPIELAIPEAGTAPAHNEQELAFQLLRRMHTLCADHGIKLIVLDIPLPAANGGFESSFPESWNGRVSQFGDVIISSSLLNDHGSQLIHVPHGHHHISEYTHGRFAEVIAQVIMDDQYRSSVALP